jgi:hypothetical protein
MRTQVALSAPVVLCLLFAPVTAPAAADSRPRAPQRQESGDAAAVARVEASLEHLSQVLDRTGVSELPAGSSWRVKASDEGQVLQALKAVERDLGRSLGSMDVAQVLLVLQETNLAAFRPLVSVYSDQPWVDCGDVAGCSNAQVLEALDRIGALLSARVRATVGAWRSSQGLEPGVEQQDVHPDGFDAWVHDVMDESGHAIGVESIDG